MALYGGFNNSVLPRTGPTEEEKRRDAENRAMLCARLRIYMGVQLLVAAILLLLGMLGAIFHDPDDFFPAFIGPLISGPSLLLGAFGSYRYMTVTKDFAQRKASEYSCGLIALVLSNSFILVGCGLGIAFGVMTVIPDCNDHLEEEPAKSCEGSITARAIAIACIAACGMTLAVALFSIYFLSNSSIVSAMRKAELAYNIQQLNELLQQPTEGFLDPGNTQMVRHLQQLQ